MSLNGLFLKSMWQQEFLGETEDNAAGGLADKMQMKLLAVILGDILWFGFRFLRLHRGELPQQFVIFVTAVLSVLMGRSCKGSHPETTEAAAAAAVLSRLTWRCWTSLWVEVSQRQEQMKTRQLRWNCISPRMPQRIERKGAAPPVSEQHEKLWAVETRPRNKGKTRGTGTTPWGTPGQTTYC